MVKKGFSILELVVAMFLLTIVVGTGLLIIAGNLNVMQKANEMLLASAVAQYCAESVKTIDFPPVYADRQLDFPKKISENAPLTSSYQVPAPDPSFRVYMGCVWYKSDGSEATDNETDLVVLRKVKIEVRRPKDNYLLFSMPVFITRNGMY
ncbi:MAG TPA: prepilin-type N-terminal cleavage/methylation domain-containing protein [bacterium]|nr:prepilin-type N-terminal cleavage/methylation domain-containing protein [bacterium]